MTKPGQLPFMKNLRFTRLRLALFAVMFMLVLMMGSRILDVAQQLAAGTAPSAVTPVMAETPPADAKKADAPTEKKEDAAKPAAPVAADAKPADAKPTDAKPAEAKPADAAPASMEAKPADTKPAETSPAAAPAAAAPEAAAPAADSAAAPAAAPEEEPENYTEAEVTILKKLSARRQELDRHSRELDQREALLRVTEQRVDRKINDLRAMQDQIRKVLGDADKAQLAQEASMVKIYETMKPKEAATIFENLELPVLMSVVSRMKESKVAPILGAMNPVKAKELTTALMEKKPLPPAP